MEGAPVGRKGVRGDFGALESGLLAQVPGDIGVGVDFVEPLHLAAVGAVGEAVLAGVAEFQQEQENQQDARLGGGQGAAASSAMTAVRMTRSSPGNVSLLAKITASAMASVTAPNPARIQVPRAVQEAASSSIPKAASAPAANWKSTTTAEGERALLSCGMRA